MIYFSFGLVLKSNSQTIWIPWIKKHNSIKFECKIWKTSIKFLNSELSIQNNKLIIKIYWKSTDRQNFLLVDLEHPKSLKGSISYSHALRIKQICTTPNDCSQYWKELKQTFINQGHKPELINKHKSSKKNWREKTFSRKRQYHVKRNKNSLLLTYNRSLPKISEVFCTHWNILSIKKLFKVIFQDEPVTVFKCNKNVKELIGINEIECYKVKKIVALWKRVNSTCVK